MEWIAILIMIFAILFCIHAIRRWKKEEAAFDHWNNVTNKLIEAPFQEHLWTRKPWLSSLPLPLLPTGRQIHAPPSKTNSVLTPRQRLHVGIDRPEPSPAYMGLFKRAEWKMYLSKIDRKPGIITKTFILRVPR